jgi:hypothetical protein
MSPRVRPTLLLAALALTALAAPQALRADTEKGSYIVSIGGRTVGVEAYELVSSPDSVVVNSSSFQVLPHGDASDTLRKQMQIVVDALDFGLKDYKSVQKIGHDVVTRGLVINEEEFTSYRDDNGYGVGDRYELPPGRVFVLDRYLFSSFDLMCRSLHGRVFQKRPISLFVLGPKDTLIEATATDMGRDTIRWAAKPVVARKLTIGDAHTTFTAWAAPEGKLLRLEEPSTALRVERAAPPAATPKKRPKTPPGG